MATRTTPTLANQWFANSSKDMLSGLVVAFAMIPEAIAFSIIAGVDPKVGLYASFSIAVLTAICGGRPGMISAATAAWQRFARAGGGFSGAPGGGTPEGIGRRPDLLWLPGARHAAQGAPPSCSPRTSCLRPPLLLYVLSALTGTTQWRAGRSK